MNHDRRDALAGELFVRTSKKLGFIEYNGGLSVNHSLLTVIVHD